LHDSLLNEVHLDLYLKEDNDRRKAGTFVWRISCCVVLLRSQCEYALAISRLRFMK
jgi:hypothetical protein